MTQKEKLIAVMDYVQNNEDLAKSLEEVKYNGLKTELMLIKRGTYWSSANRELYALIDELMLFYMFPDSRQMLIWG